ncbi:MAG: tRNA 2-thiouridine(34) synthase MnmA [Bacteroidales bacterium]|nr:tRNA 2-thiouridine(34) synthase MnmA [Bacteroidales bacterium]MCF8386426.1 tRNA 2-thiouridine(34) synthase MnmA [Bacteroidales bacterium]MCF8397136.1 tRNA 2-thiouridine(34) synthase MnmA [Bacteroidales bacterium]
MNIAALVSGGVDSSVTVPVLKEQGYDPVIVYIRIAMEDVPGFIDCPSEEDIEIASYIAKKYGCRFEIVDLQQEYWERVVDYTITTVKKGLTPNPDVMCNRMIKFGSFEEKFGKDFDKISTGHYASVIEKNGQYYLGTAKDKRKDQTYFLSRITYDQLSKVMFPIWDFQKGEVRKLAEELKLPSAKRPDSQGICFLGKINYNDFIRKYVGDKEGYIIELETGRKLGRHKGYWFHTIGQRKGLGLSQGPWFVVRKNIEENIIYVSHGYDPMSQYGDEIVLDDFLFINETPDRDYSTGQAVKFKIRHTPEFTKGTLTKNKDQYILKSAEKIAGIAPGQFGVIYDEQGRICLGSGIISEEKEII